MTDQTKPNAQTREAAEADAHAEHGANETPTPEEEQAAEKNTVSPEVKENYQEATERGASQQGEGRITQ
jgi:hypothetical protein